MFRFRPHPDDRLPLTSTIHRYPRINGAFAEAILLSTFLSGLILPGIVYADCVDYGTTPNYPPFVGTVQSLLTDLVVSGNYAYVVGTGVGTDNTAFQVIDISNPSQPTVVGTAGYPIISGGGKGVAVSGSYAYVLDPSGYDPDCCGPGLLRIIDISNPASPTLVANVASNAGNVSTSSPLSGIAVSGNYVYVACPDGLQVIDVSRPTRPSTVVTMPVDFPCWSLALSGHYVYVMGGKVTNTGYPNFTRITTTGVRVIDISDPGSPVIVGALTLTAPSDYPTTNSWYQMVIAGNYLYVAGYPGLQVIDVSNPSSPAIVATNLGFCRDVAVQGSHAYLVDGYNTEIRVVDILNPLSPTTVGHIAHPGGSAAMSALAVTATASHLFVLGGVTCCPPGAHGLFLFLHQCSAAGCSADVDAGGPYETCGEACLPLNGSVTDGSLPVTWSASGSGTFSPNNTTLNALYCPSAADVAAGSVTLTLTAGSCSGVLAALTLSPGVPVQAMDVDPNTFNTQSGGNYITAHLEFPDGYDPAQVLLESVRLNGTVAASPDFFEIKDWNHNHVPDVALKFPRDAVEGTLGEGDQVPVSIFGTLGDRCFLGTTMIRVIRPHLTHPNGGESYVAGVRTLVEWENPQGWTVSYAQIYYSADGGNSWNLIADQLTGQSYVWAAPTEPTENGRLRVVLVDDVGMMGYDSSDGPFVVGSATGVGDVPPTVHRLYQNSPNPFAAATRTAFDLPVEGRVTVEVFDLTGRKVRALADDWYPAGKHDVSWDGRDAVGRSLAGGIYFLHMKAGLFSDTKRMYLQR